LDVAFFFSSGGAICAGTSSAAGGVCSSAGAVFCFGVVAAICEVGSAFFFFDFWV
jgi:hypothetical protein